MPAPLTLSDPLAGLRKHACSRCHPDGSAAVPADADAPPDAIRRRWERLPKPRCAQCEMLLLLQAVDRLIPNEEVDDWLKRPNQDLDDRTPIECIDAGDYEPVFTALFFLHPDGSVS